MSTADNCRSVDPTASTLAIRTRATGLLARLAHDLELEATGFSGGAEPAGPEGWRAELTFPVRGIKVNGVVRKGKVVRGVLSPSDVDEIVKRIRETVLLGPEVRVTAESRGAGRALVTVVAPKGIQKVEASLTRTDREDGSTEVAARLALSLRQLGVAEIKGPLGAFKVFDDVEVVARLVVKA